MALHEATKAELIAENKALRRQLDQLARTGVENLEAVIRDSADGILVVDSEGMVLFANPAAEQILEREKASLVGSRLGVPVSEGERVEMNLLTPSGETVPVELWSTTTVWAGQPAIRVSLRNLTEIRLAESALRESEAKFRVLAETVPDCIWMMNPELVITYVNPALERILGYSPGEFIGTTLSRHMDPGPLSDVMVFVRRLQSEKGRGPRVVTLETSMIHKEGHQIPVEVSTSLRVDEEGRPIMFQGVSRDITERKKAFQQAQRLAAIVESTRDAIVSKTLDGTITTWNGGAERMFGFSAREAIGRNISFLIAPDRPNELTEALRKISKGEIVEPYETVRYTKEGNFVQILLAISPIRNETGRVVGASSIARDVTELERARKERLAMEEQFHQAQKLESVGRLAGGVAHDFNNMLNVILGYGDLILGKLHETDPLRDFANEIVEAGNRSAALTRQLLAFSRKQTLRPQVVNLNDTIKNLEKMLRRLIGEDIELYSNLTEDLAPVEVDPGQIEQAIMNVAVNARDAMPKGGTLTLDTKNTALGDDCTEESVKMAPGEYVLLSMTDTGFGMCEETRSQLFEPFFTTKEQGKGTGLGLSMVYGIVKQSGGYIWVDSEPGQGSTFRVYLPATKTRETAKETVDEAKQRQGSGECILVVEDERSLRKLCRAVLKKAGYDVMTAANGGEALLLIEEENARPDLIITDVVMPGMSGKVLVDRLKRTLPDTKILFMSGYTDDRIVQHGVLDADFPFIEKPFSTKAFIKKVSEIL